MARKGWATARLPEGPASGEPDGCGVEVWVQRRRDLLHDQERRWSRLRDEADEDQAVGQGHLERRQLHSQPRSEILTRIGVQRVSSLRRCSWLRLICICALALAGTGCQLFETTTPAAPAGPLLPGQTADVFTTARPTIAAVSQRLPGQATHSCSTDRVSAQHARRDGRSRAPSTATRRDDGSCRGSSERPDLHDLPRRDRRRSPADQADHRDARPGHRPAWQRVFGYPAPSHVKFNHAPHIRAKVECATCHGNIAEQTRRPAERRYGHGLLRDLSHGQEGSRLTA